MLLVDDRDGSKDLAEPLSHMGLEVELTRMEAGDVAFEGRGVGGKPVSVGVELKKLPDLVSSLKSGRLAEQLQKMLGPEGAYDYGWLLIEGDYRVSKSGEITTYHGRKAGWEPLPGGMMASRMLKEILTLGVCGGLRPHFASSRHATLQFLMNLYHWWTDKDLDKHSSHLQVHTPASFLPVSDMRAVFQRFPGVGPHASSALEKYFEGNLLYACQTPASEWAEIQIPVGRGKTKKLGRATAERIQRFIRGKA